MGGVCDAVINYLKSITRAHDADTFERRDDSEAKQLQQKKE